MPGRKERGQLELFITGSLRGLIPDGHVLVKTDLDLSRICAAPSARLGHLAFEGQGAFASQC